MRIYAIIFQAVVKKLGAKKRNHTTWQYSSLDLSTCLKCKAGNILLAESNSCMKCPSGTYSSLERESCLKCDDGYISREESDF